jgi:hypothetical protein
MTDVSPQIDDRTKSAKPPKAPVRIRHNDNDTYTLDEWRRLRGISASTERRMRAAGLGPELVHLTIQHLGVTVRADREWVQRGGAVEG